MTARARLHRGLVGARALVGQRYLADPALRAAYVADLAPRTEAALARVLGALWPARAGVRRAVDLGAGTGAASAAVNAYFPGVEVVAVDQVPAPGLIVADLARRPFARPAGVSGRFDLVVAAHVLNELALGMADRAALVATWCEQLLAPGGTCLVLEPALRETSRALLEVREALVARGLFVIAPCLWQGPCPALARPRDWCHDAAPAVAAGRSRVDFSYLAVRQAGDPSQDVSAYRVVSDLLPEKGRVRLYGCGPAGRMPLVRLSRDRTAANAAFDQAVRGDLIAVQGASPGGDGLRIGKDTTVHAARGPLTPPLSPAERGEGEEGSPGSAPAGRPGPQP
jgi:ribosomal protein RSM22 (predicted rRNA methylase)